MHNPATGQFEPGAHPGTLVARLPAPTAATDTKLAVVADPHVATRAEGTSKLFEKTEHHLRNAVADILTRDVDAVLSVGDLTKDGEPWNYEAVDAVLAELSVPFYAVPGNHDVPKASDDHETPPVSEFARRYAPEDSFPFSTRVGDVDIVGVNSAGTATFLHDTHDGGLSPSAEQAVEERLTATDDPLVLTHHNLPAMYDQLRAHRDAVEPAMSIPPTTRNGDAYARTFADGGTGLLLTGHLHLPATATQTGVREVLVPTTCSFPQAYYTLAVGPAGTEVRMHTVATRGGVREAHAVRTQASVTSRGLTAIAADRLAQVPFIS